ncbi:tRNA threonylcarbamoyl adenosine modification protein YeaZ [Roseimicrobium gellanilyticum]|uniref:tRNA threonylcarbamoyl adenosine modification protein YeaZ n=1 Tax=Roseimicrobium gellanilyticum TaxID=748857 RepID=A0A366HPG2_9BACT|nr:tRNA (adenosine(37)-N6)-threonylcarbamoyltransferase complex dimerization subunit type 1 TsaB [Roseimicrobium gellanilyticum]RBP45400.1 tRNA threonylcarbamoyl adenosine modification protein YeaZ [Roseimicrobium gellanilyticum]
MPDCVLAIETSTPRGSVAVVKGDATVVYEHSFSSERSHNSQLFEPLREALEKCGDDLRAIVVGTGPASYTGVRIGIAAAQGVAMSRGVPLIGLPSVLAPEVDGGVGDRFVVCGDARRGKYFVAEVRGDELVGEVVTMDADAFREKHAARGMDTPWYTYDGKVPLGLEDVMCVMPSAIGLAEIAAGMVEDEIAELAKRALEPVYLAEAYVTQPKRK